MELSTRQLRAFVALADTRHFTKAAQRCHLTQPAFSALIRNLELGLGARLFDRSTRSVELTPAGVLFEGSARRLLADFGLAQEALDDHVARRRGRVVVAALPSLAAGWLPGILAAYQHDFPGVSLSLIDALANACLDRVRGGEADFAVAALREDMTGLHSTFLYADRFYVVCPEGHPLAQRARVPIAALGDWPLIHMARSSSVRRRLDTLVPSASQRSAFEVDHLATAMGLVRAGLGISLMPGMALLHHRVAGLVIRPLAGRSLDRPLHLIALQGRTLSAAAAGLYDRILEARTEIGRLERALTLS